MNFSEVRFCSLNCLSQCGNRSLLLFVIIIDSTKVTTVYFYSINEDNLCMLDVCHHLEMLLVGLYLGGQGLQKNACTYWISINFSIIFKSGF
jgi:hypothetical protein